MQMRCQKGAGTIMHKCLGGFISKSLEINCNKFPYFLDTNVCSKIRVDLCMKDYICKISIIFNDIR